MKGIVAYSKPRGIYGRYYIFTVVLDFTPPHEKIKIEVIRYRLGKREVYSCHNCGHYGKVTISFLVREQVQPKERSVKGNLNFYRYDTVEPGDQIHITFRDDGLIFLQETDITIGQAETWINSKCLACVLSNLRLEVPPPMYQVFLINWDQHIDQRQEQGRPPTVEEELISKVMRNEKITVAELLLEPPAQPLAIQDSHKFIEGTLRYKSNDRL